MFQLHLLSHQKLVVNSTLEVGGSSQQLSKSVASVYRPAPYKHRHRRVHTTRMSAFDNLMDLEFEESPRLKTRDEWVQGRKTRVLHDVAQAGRRLGFTIDQMYENFEILDTLFLDFTPDLDKMNERDWAILSSDSSGITRKMMALKYHFPDLDLQVVLAKNPRFLLKGCVDVEECAMNVKQYLSEARNADQLLQAVPVLLEPKTLISVLITFQRWFPSENPITVLEEDPDVLRRAQEKDVPFDPVFFDGEVWTAPSYDSKGKLLPWQKYIRKDVHKKMDWDDGSMWNRRSRGQDFS